MARTKSVAVLASVSGAILCVQPIGAQVFPMTVPPPAPVAAPVGPAAPIVVMNDDVRPAAPMGVSASFAAPSRDLGGAYLTPNRDLTPEEVTWHVRVALNVAALGCRGGATDETVAAYNAMLTAAKAQLATASAAVDIRYKRQFAAAWQERSDDAMTRLYNFFAQPIAREEFCGVARAVLHEAAAVEPDNFAGFTVAALPRLEAPFLTAFARYDAYRASLAAWQSRHMPVQVAAVRAAGVEMAVVQVAGVQSVAASPSAPSMMRAVASASTATLPVVASPVMLAAVSTVFGPQP